ncbi:hypothetical protein D3C76_1203960 [compost metagenome]
MVADHATKAFQDDLQEDAAVRFGRRRDEVVVVVVDPVAADQTHFPAAAVIFEAAHGFQRAALVVVELPARNGVPVRHHRPDDREVVLVDPVGFAVEVVAAEVRVERLAVGAIAVTDVDDLVQVVFRLVVEHHVAGVGVVSVRVPVVVRAYAPVAVKAVDAAQCIRRTRAVGVRITDFHALST